MLLPLLATKLYLPSVRPNLASRPRLIEILDQGLRQQRRLTLVAAPAGYGKSMLVIEWLHHLKAAAGQQPRLSWLSLDESDNDPVRFTLYLTAALQKLDDAVGADMPGLLNSPALPPLETLMTGLVNDLWEAVQAQNAAGSEPARQLLVLDDFHKISLPWIHDAVQFLLDHAPESLHMVIATREDPPLQLARMRVHGSLTELRTQELRFTHAEAGEFIHRVMGLDLPDEWIGGLADRTEGWIAGLQLAALSLQGRSNVNQFLEDFRGSHRYVIDYLMDEVLRLQSDEIRRFLHQTSILERFNAALCEAVTGRADCQPLITQIEQTNLFLIPLDDRREWYRYHHLFSDFLRVELSEIEEAGLHVRAAAWFYANDRRSEAIGHALLARDYSTAGRWIEAAADEMIGGGRLTALLHWIDALPGEILRTSGDLVGYAAWCQYFTGLFDEARQRLEAISREEFEIMRPLAQARVLSLQAWNANAREQDATVTLAEQALALIGDADPLLRATTLLPLGHGLRRRNDWPAAAKAYRQAVEAGQHSGAPLIIVSPTNSLAVTLVDQGERLQADALCREIRLRLVDGRGRNLPVADLLCIAEALVAYEGNRLAQARDLARKAREASERFLTGRVMGGEAERTLIRAYTGLGDVSSAQAVIAEIRLAGAPLNWITPMVDALEAEMLIKLGQADAAADWAGRYHLTAGVHSPEILLPARELLFTTYARLLIHWAQPEAALALLDLLEARMRAGGRVARRITVLLLQAQAHALLGAQATVFERLDEAIQLAAPQGYLRRFLDEGRAVHTLLQAYRRTERAAPVVQPFLAALEDAFFAEQSSTQSQPPPAPALPSPAQVNKGAPQTAREEPLSEAETRVLRLLAAGLSNSEIAAELVISVGTVKWHAHNIYQKLGVSSRTQAISWARQQKIL